MNKKAFIQYLAALLLFGSNGVVASFIALDSMQIVLLRTLIGSILLVLLFFIGSGRMTFYKHKQQLIFLGLSGAAMGTSWMFLYEAYSRVGVGIASLLYYCGPIIVMLLSPLLFREKLTANKLIGFLAVVIGVILINGNIFSKSGDLFGIACGLLSAVMYAFMVIFNKKAKDIVGLENSALQLIIAFFTTAVIVGCKHGYIMQITSADMLPILILGVLNTGIGCCFYFSSIGQLNVQTVAICGYLEPLSAVLFSALFLKETLLPLQLLGVVCILGGAMCGELIKR